MRHGMLDVSDGHSLYYEVHGADQGIPVVVLHGGPGGGLQRRVLKFFDLRKWRVILYDQRGCGRSMPYLGLRANTTWHLVSDMERLRAHLGLERWTIFGGSWGSTLALAYASRHGERIQRMILRGIYLAESWENTWMYGERGAAHFAPKEWRQFVTGSGTPYRSTRSLLTTYRRRLLNRKTQRAAATAWWRWEAHLSTLKPTPHPPIEPDSIAVLENHYFTHGCWLKPGQLLRAARRIRCPVTIIQGRYDMVCPPAAAIALAEAIPHATLRLTMAGHSAFDPATAKELRAALRKVAI
jgi:proline iminopeptidase